MQEVTRKLKLFVNRYAGPKTHNQSGQLKLSNKKADLSFAVAGVFMFSFLLSFIAGSFIIQPQDGQAVTGLGLVGAPAMTFNTSSGSVNMEITPSASGTFASASHTLTASTNVPTGYSLSLTTSTTPSLATSLGTISAPTVLSNNTWGFALNRVSSSTAANTITNGFDASYAVPTPSATSKWANPSANTTIKNTLQATSSDTTTIYYGAKADMTLKAGTYSNSIRYTATPNLVSIPAPGILSVTPGSGTTAGGTAIQIVGTGFAVNDQSVTTAVTIGGMNCEDVSISSNTPAMGQDTVYCTTPVHPTVAAVNVAVTTWTGTATKTNGFVYIAPTPTITAPTASQRFNAGTTSTTLTVTTDTPGICYYGTASNPTTQMTTTGGTTHSVSVTGLANQSTNTRYVRCQAANGHSYSADKSVTFYVKAATPTVTITAPTANQIFTAGTTSTTLSVTTNAAATCYYGTATNPTTAMSTTGGTTHSVSITGLANQSTNTRYVRCRTGSGNTASDYSANQNRVFYVRAATPAVPTLSPANGASVNTGTTTINVTSSGATCKWGTASGSYPNASGTTRTTAVGTNTLYYSCVTGTGNTASTARTGSWSYTGQAPVDQTGDAIQTVTAATCPTTRTRVYDARDNRTYWIQKLADGKCWMLTNLAYAGGGTNTYGDAKTITNSNTVDYTKPYYMIPTGSNVTSGTTNPSTSTNGTGQYGYLYNWCAAMGNQSSTSACANATTPAPNTSISICPAGWRLPTGGSGGEFQALNNAVNSGSTSSDSGLRSAWLAMYSGVWSNGFVYQGSNGYYWSSTQPSATGGYYLAFSSGSVSPANVNNKRFGFAVRCVAV